VPVRGFPLVAHCHRDLGTLYAKTGQLDQLGPTKHANLAACLAEEVLDPDGPSGHDVAAGDLILLGQEEDRTAGTINCHSAASRVNDHHHLGAVLEPEGDFLLDLRVRVVRGNDLNREIRGGRDKSGDISYQLDPLSADKCRVRSQHRIRVGGQQKPGFSGINASEVAR
jgi:hypothetical protein